MSLKNMSKEDLELLSYKDITNLILEEEGPKNTSDLFKQIVKLLGLSENTFENKIGDYYTSLTTDKRFVLIDGTWDLRNHHTSDKAVIKVDDEDEDEEEFDENVMEDEENENEDNDNSDNFDDTDDDYDDTDEDDLKDLVVIDEDEIELEQ